MRSKVRRLVVFVVGATTLVAAACTPWPRASTVVADATSCATVLHVAARGSSAPLGSKEVRAMWTDFRAALGPDVTLEQLELGDLDGDGRQDAGGFTAIDAFSAPAVDLAARPDETDVAFIGGYNQSRRIGTLELVQLLASRARTCPDQRIVLSGFSMGAHATGLALKRLPAAVAARVDSVEFFGDPSFMLGPWARVDPAVVTAGHGFLGERPEYVPPAFAARTESWCGEWDGLCTGNLVLSVAQALPCSDPAISGQPYCRFRHVDYEKWATAPGMATSGRLVRAALAATAGR
jgi:hypothetical protein